MKDQDYGRKLKDSSKKSLQNTHCSKMLPICDLEDLQPLSKISGRSGMTVNGILYQLAELAPFTDERGYGLLPTLKTTQQGSTSKGYGDNLTEALCKRLGIPCKKYPNPSKTGLYPTLTTFDSGAPLPPRKKNKSGGQKDPLVSVMCSSKDFRLNPLFAERYMGYPDHWTQIEDKE